MSRVVRTLLVAALTAATGALHAAERSWQVLVPTSGFVQFGAAQEKTRMLVAGATWDWGWRKDLGWGELSGYWEASLGRWSAEENGTPSSAWVTQIGITPVLRLAPDGWRGAFVEGGIGLNVLTPVYHNREKQFSTEFNFGDHLAVGWRFGERRQHEIALRLQHFSNAGIKKPNPGEDFVQLRYTRRF